MSSYTVCQEVLKSFTVTHHEWHLDNTDI